MTVLPDFESAEFAPALKALRKQLQLSRTALAAQVGLSTAAIQRYEAQDSSNIKPSRDAYERLCKVLAELQQQAGARAVASPPPRAAVASTTAPVAANPAASPRSEPVLAPGILLADATLEQLIARAKLLGAKKVTIEF